MNGMVPAWTPGTSPAPTDGYDAHAHDGQVVSLDEQHPQAVG